MTQTADLIRKNLDAAKSALNRAEYYEAWEYYTNARSRFDDLEYATDDTMSHVSFGDLSAMENEAERVLVDGRGVGFEGKLNRVLQRARGILRDYALDYDEARH